MDSRVRLSTKLKSLISDYEHHLDQGKNIYLDDKEYHSIIYYYERENELDRALETIDKAINQYTYRSDFLVLKSRILIKKGQFDLAKKFIQQAELITPFEFETQLLKINILVLEKKYDEAILIIDELKTYSNRSDMQDVYVTEAYLYESLQEYDMMFECLKKALIINPDKEEALRMMNVSVDQSRNYEESILIHKLIVDNNPYNHLAWYNLGSAYGCVGEYQKAIEAIEYSFIIDPEFEQGYLDCAEYCCEIKKYSRALDIYQEAANLFGLEYDILYNMAICQFELNMIDEAKRSLFEAIEIDSYNDEALALLAKCHLVHNDFRSAIKVLRKAISIESNIEDYYFQLAHALKSEGDLNKASFYFLKAAKKGSEIPTYWEEYVAFLICEQQYKKAVSIVEKAERSTFSYKLLYLKACSLIMIGDKKAGFAVLEEALHEALEDHEIIQKLPDSVKNHTEINSIINYFKG